MRVGAVAVALVASSLGAGLAYWQVSQRSESRAAGSLPVRPALASAEPSRPRPAPPGAAPTVQSSDSLVSAPDYEGQPAPPAREVREGLESRVAASGVNRDESLAGDVAAAISKSGLRSEPTSRIAVGEPRCYAIGCLVSVHTDVGAPDRTGTFKAYWSGPMAFAPEEVSASGRDVTILFMRE